VPSAAAALARSSRRVMVTSRIIFAARPFRRMPCELARVRTEASRAEALTWWTRTGRDASSPASRMAPRNPGPLGADTGRPSVGLSPRHPCRLLEVAEQRDPIGRVTGRRRAYGAPQRLGFRNLPLAGEPLQRLGRLEVHHVRGLHGRCGHTSDGAAHGQSQRCRQNSECRRRGGTLASRCYDRVVNPADIRAFVERDWEAVQRETDRYWVEWKGSVTLAEALAAADALRRHAVAVRPGWPDAADGSADFAVHLRVSDALRAVSRPGSR
jgi:hypothetical protein